MKVSPRETLLSMLPPRSVGAEIGVFKGGFSRSLLRHVRPTRLHLIDPWKVAETGPRKTAWYGADNVTQADMDAIHAGVVDGFRSEVRAGVVQVHRGTSRDIMPTLPDQSLDWAYIDGDHSYEGVLTDLRLCLAKVKPRSLIAGDDYTVTERWWKDGVVRALHDFLREAGSSVIIRLVLENQFVLQRTAS